MPAIHDETNAYIQLRDKAEALLEAGATPTTGHCSMSVDALRLLHRLSSNPRNAEDALKLLHELQVHQGELDLQNEELAANERVLVEDLHHYRTLYDCAPVGYVVVERGGAVLQANPAAAELFGVDQDDLEGRRIDSLLDPHNRPLLLGLLESVAETAAGGSCVAETGGGGEPRHLHFLASIPPGGEHILLVCCESGNAG